jgi:hypothetical protein
MSEHPDEREALAAARQIEAGGAAPPQLTQHELRMAQLGLEIRQGIRLIARAIACFLIIPIVFFVVSRHYFYILGGAFAFAGVAYLVLGVRKRRMADRGLLALAAEASKTN